MKQKSSFSKQITAYVQTKDPSVYSDISYGSSGVLSCPYIHIKRGSLTLEACASLSLFLMFMISMISFLIMSTLSLNIQTAMDETARNLSRAAYLMEKLDGGDENRGKDAAYDAGLSIAAQGINPLSVKVLLSSKKQLAGSMGLSRIIGGKSGLLTHNTVFDQETGILDMIVEYDYKVPWLPGRLGTVRFVQRQRCHVWTGRSLKNLGASPENGSQKVYVTPSGTVYHTSPSCNYLDLSIHTADPDEIKNLRNVNGARYTRCSSCDPDASCTEVYITDHGTSYHASLGCSALKRTVIEKEITDVEGMRMCTKCREGIAHDH